LLQGRYALLKLGGGVRTELVAIADLNQRAAVHEEYSQHHHYVRA
jgi:hypothetical protein